MPVRPVVEDGEESLEEEPREAISSAVDTWRHASDSRDSGAGRLATLDESDFPAPPGGAAADPRAGVEGVTHTVLFRMALGPTELRGGLPLDFDPCANLCALGPGRVGGRPPAGSAGARRLGSGDAARRAAATATPA